MTPQSPPPDQYTTVGQVAQTEIRIQRSRFIAVAAPAADETAARAAIARQAAAFHDARHVCYAWRLGVPPQTSEHRSDAGEPSGTAGEPILSEIRKRELNRVVVVVVRYFGGIKLGTGGLARAYGQAAATALTAAETRTVKMGRSFRVMFPYALQKTFGHLLRQHGGETVSEDYATNVQWTIWLPHSQWEAFAARLTEATAGSVDLAPSPDNEPQP